MQRSMDQLSDVLTAISHPSRRAIIWRLAGRTATRFTDIAKPFDLSLNAITKHLKLLERAGLISREKQGREVFISFRPRTAAAGLGAGYMSTSGSGAIVWMNSKNTSKKKRKKSQ